MGSERVPGHTQSSRPWGGGGGGGGGAAARGGEAGRGVNVLIVDDDPAWHRALQRGLLTSAVDAVVCVGSREEAEIAMAEIDRCLVLTELSLAGSRLAGLGVVEAAQRVNAPVAIVAGDAIQMERIRAVPVLPKVRVSTASLRALLRYLERGL